MSNYPEWIKCIGTQHESLCGKHGGEWRFVDLTHVLRTVAKKERLLPCPECMAMAANERVAALEAEVTRQETLRLHEGQKLQNHIAALEEKLQDRLEVTDLVATAEEELTKARREGARDALGKALRGMVTEGLLSVQGQSWLKKEIAALGEVDRGC